MGPDAARRWEPSGETAMAWTGALPVSSVSSTSPVARSRRCTLASSPAVYSPPSGLKNRLVTAPSWHPWDVHLSSPRARSNALTSPAEFPRVIRLVTDAAVFFLDLLPPLAETVAQAIEVKFSARWPCGPPDAAEEDGASLMKLVLRRPDSVSNVLTLPSDSATANESPVTLNLTMSSFRLAPGVCNIAAASTLVAELGQQHHHLQAHIEIPAARLMVRRRTKWPSESLSGRRQELCCSHWRLVAARSSQDTTARPSGPRVARLVAAGHAATRRRGARALGYAHAQVGGRAAGSTGGAIPPRAEHPAGPPRPSPRSQWTQPRTRSWRSAGMRPSS
mmetsp:Transcript_29136/g.92994  ORF Transcript_29136/g.92994 Transcript_29136/m.92994 type:complete len:335 (-) Transcript_29136:2925-3929(-)